MDNEPSPEQPLAPVTRHEDGGLGAPSTAPWASETWEPAPERGEAEDQPAGLLADGPAETWSAADGPAETGPAADGPAADVFDAAESTGLDELRDMTDRLLDQTAILPDIADQIANSLELFGDRLVDGLNEIFGNRLANMVEGMQLSVQEAQRETSDRLDDVAGRVESVAANTDEMAGDMRAILDRVDGLERGGSGQLDPELVAQLEAATGGDVAGQLAGVRRTLEKLDRSGTIRRKRIDQLRAQVGDILEGTNEASRRVADQLAQTGGAIDELNSWMGAVHTEVEELREQMTAAAAAERPAPEASSDATGRIGQQLAEIVSELEQLRRRVGVQVKPPTIEAEQVQAIADVVVSAILEAVQLEPGEA